MNNTRFLSITTAVAGAVLLSASANANVSPDPIEMHAHLAQEKVACEIKGDTAVVTGSYTFNHLTDEDGFWTVPVLYLPVYAVEGTPVKEMMPEFTVNEVKAEVTFIKPEWEDDIKDFGEMPQLEGQRVYWFYARSLPEFPVTNAAESPKQFVVQIRYAQKLCNDKFIYTPLIPKMKKDHDYGEITVTADRKLTLLESEKHSFAEEEGKFIIEPSDKRAIVVEVAKAAPQLP